MFKCKLQTQSFKSQRKIYVAGRSSSSYQLKKVPLQKQKKIYSLGWFYTGDASLLNHLLLL